MNAYHDNRNKSGHDSSIEFDAFDVHRGAYDNAMVAQVVGVDG